MLTDKALWPQMGRSAGNETASAWSEGRAGPATSIHLWSFPFGASPTGQITMLSLGSLILPPRAMASSHDNPFPTMRSGSLSFPQAGQR